MSKLKVSIRSIVMFLFALMFVVAGLSLLSRYTSEQFIYRSKKPLKIGATYMTLNNPFFNVIDDEVRNVVEANGDVLISLDPALDLQKQKEQIHYLIEQGVSALIINPVDFTGISEELKEAREANIPVITVDTDVFDEDLVAYSLMSDNYDAGVQCAKDMMKRKKSYCFSTVPPILLSSGFRALSIPLRISRSTVLWSESSVRDSLKSPCRKWMPF